MKSEYIYFEGEQVKAHIESKLKSGNAELMSDSEQQQSVDDSTLSSRSDPATSVSSDIHMKENDAGRRDEKYIANEAVIDQNLERDEDHSHKECSTYANSPNASLLGRPSTFDNPQIAETKDSFNSRASANKAYTKYSTYDPEILMLKSKFEKFTDNVVTRLDELAFEINVVKENKPYSIVTLEGVIDELKKEKAELYRKNEALRESNNNMQQTISQLSQTNKQLEEEKSSLVTAIKIIQNDFNQQAISKKKSGEAREESGGGIDDNISSSDIESDEEPNDKFKSSTKGTHVRRQKKKLIENVKADKTKKNKDAGADKKTTTIIVGDSMVKYPNANRLIRSMLTGNHNIHVETYRGSTTEAMAHHIRPCLVKQSASWDFLKKKSIKTGSNHKKARNQLNSLIKSTKAKYYEALNQCRKDPKTMWKTINQLTNTKSKTTNINELIINQEIVTQPEKIADSLNTYFNEIGTVLAKDLPKGNNSFETYVVPTDKSFEINRFSSINVKNVISKINTSKATGHDPISLKLLKDSADIIAE
ncbi:Hypothetical predicted protein [Paramuricea clavata]|uniref:Uncharacterized protein n=1 Tax=Paramuricea clavata TaxID=317549 RepID=A0A6S7IBC5_PARCT|nr:Hypothetical predicted protein [Paramuricea clavata]